MNDYWNDPPAEEEPPFCEKCEEYMKIAENWLSAKCTYCGKEWAAPPKYIPEPADIELPNDVKRNGRREME